VVELQLDLGGMEPSTEVGKTEKTTMVETVSFFRFGLAKLTSL